MSSIITHYSDIDDMLKDINLPLMKNPLVYVTRFEDHDFNENYSGIYTHDYFEFSFSLGYNANVSVGQQTSNILEDSLVFISPGQLVKWDKNGHTQNTAVGYILLFKPEFLLFGNGVFGFYKQFPFFKRNTSPGYRLTADQKIMIQSFFEKINEEYERNDENSLEIIRSYLTILLFNTKRMLEFSAAKSQLRTRADEITYQFENAIIQAKHKRQAIKHYAIQLNISPIYLSECIKKSTGKTAKQIIDEYLILEAKSLLKQSSNAIAQIAYMLGFEDNSNFVKYFKKHTGLTPKIFKEKP